MRRIRRESRWHLTKRGANCPASLENARFSFVPSEASGSNCALLDGGCCFTAAYRSAIGTRLCKEKFGVNSARDDGLFGAARRAVLSLSCLTSILGAAATPAA